jgi:16S rRNA (cytosine1402-N4)-methyltransferase
MPEHRTVLLREACERLRSSRQGDQGIYVDATFGRGGHTRGLLDGLAAQGRVIALDRDPDAVAAGREAFAAEPRLTLIHGRFAAIADLLREIRVTEVDGVLMDLGVSSPQLDRAERGFSFTRNGPLDMRMDNTAGETAAAWLARATPEALTRVLREYGEERRARQLARALVAAREVRPIETTGELAALVTRVLGRPVRGRRHPATRVFQALRMEINAELAELQAALDQMPGLLAPGGVLCVISFHSLEDRLVKRFMRDRSRVDPRLARLPVVPAEAQPVLELLGGATRPGEAEVAENPRARSAVLRAARRRDDGGGTGGRA